MIAWLARFSPYGDPRGWLRGLAVAFVAGLFFTMAGPFGTGQTPLVPRLAYWMGLMVLGYLWGALVARFFFGTRLRRPGNLWLAGLFSATVIAIPFTLVVWVASGLLDGRGARVADLPLMFLPVLSVSLLITIINMLIERSRTVETHAAPTPPKFLERLPLKLRGGEVWAVEAEDHYLRLHTSRGQDLILMRLSDAVDELEGIEGMQVHRSWWVAREAIAEAKRGDGRATLTLKDDSQVPVSRTYAAEQRKRGWI